MGVRAYMIGLAGAAMLFTAVPLFAADHGQQGGQPQDDKMMGAKMMDGKEMDSEHMERHKPMQEIVGMVREMMVMMKEINHQPTPEQSAKLDKMISRLDEIVKEHEEQMKKMQEHREKKREMMDEKRDERRDKRRK